MSRRGLQLVEATIVDHVARIASGLESPDSVDLSMLSGHYTEAVRFVGLRLRKVKDGVLVCALCDERRGTFTPRGYYFHLVRSHYPEILDLVRREASRIAGASRASGPL